MRVSNATVSFERGILGIGARRAKVTRAEVFTLLNLFVKEFGWGTWIRTRTNGVRVRGSTVNLFPKAAVGAKPVGLVGGLINKSAADANTFCKKNRTGGGDGVLGGDVNRPANRQPRSVRWCRAGESRAATLLCTSRFSKKVWRMGTALVQSPQRKIEKAP